MATVEENLRLTPQERVEKHQRLLDAFLEREGFLNKLRWGQQFIQSYVHTR